MNNPFPKQSEACFFPHDLPEPLSGFAQALGQACPVPFQFAAATCLGVLSAALGSGSILRDGHRQFRPNLYLLTVANDTADRATCFDLAYAPLIQHQISQAQSSSLRNPPELSARRRQFQVERARVASDRYLSAAERSALTHDLDLGLAKLAQLDQLLAQPAPPILHTHLGRHQLLSKLAASPAVSLFTADATTPAQILRGTLRSQSIDEHCYLAAHTGTFISAEVPTPKSKAQSPNGPVATTTHHTTANPCLSLHWSLTPESWDKILTTKSTARTPSPLLHRLLTCNLETIPFTPSETCATTSPVSSATDKNSVEVTASPQDQHPLSQNPKPETPSDLSRFLKPTILNPERSRLSRFRLDIPYQLPTIPEPLRQEWSTLVNTLLHYRAAEKPVEYTLTPEARDHLRDYENHLRIQRSVLESPLDRAFVANHLDTAHRLTLLLHTIIQAEKNPIPHSPFRTPHSQEIPPAPIIVEHLPAHPLIKALRNATASEVTTRTSPTPPTSATADASPTSPLGQPGTRNPEPGTEVPFSTADLAIDLTRWFAHQARFVSDHIQKHAEKALLANLTQWLNENEGSMNIGDVTDTHNIPAKKVQAIAEAYPRLFTLTASDPKKRGPRTLVLALREDDPPQNLDPDPAEETERETIPPKSSEKSFEPSRDTTTCSRAASPITPIPPIAPMTPIPTPKSSEKFSPSLAESPSPIPEATLK